MKKADARDDLAVEVMFLGGVGNSVTGSATLLCFSVKGEKRYGLVDAGGFQGKDNRNYFFPVDASKLDFIIVTHAHFDHIGLLPKLYKDGFRGSIYITERSRRLGNHILEDAASIMKYESNAKYFSRKLVEKGKQHLANKKSKDISLRDVKNLDNAISQYEDIFDEPLYTNDEIQGLKPLFKCIPLNEVFCIVEDIIFLKFMQNPHQNGAVEVELYFRNENGQLGTFFSGDIGSKQSLLYESRASGYTNNSIDFLVMESLHGVEKRIETIDESVRNLKNIIKQGIKNQKSIYLLGFSLDREAMLVYIINQMLLEGEQFDAYFDSPLGLTELIHYRHDYLQDRSPKSDIKPSVGRKWFKKLGKNPFDLSKFKGIAKNESSHIELLNTSGPKVVLTASANGTGGRAVDYIDKFIQDPNAVFVVCGWINPDSPMSILHEAKANEIVEFNGRRHIKKCNTIRLHGFSSHGYFEEFLDILESFPYKKGVILNHAEDEPKESIKEALEKANIDYTISIPELYDAYRLSKKEGIIKLDEIGKKEAFDQILVHSLLQSAIDEIKRNE